MNGAMALGRLAEQRKQPAAWVCLSLVEEALEHQDDIRFSRRR